MQVIWTVAAISDIQRHFSYIARFNPYAASGIARRLEGAGNGLALFPRRGRPNTDGTHDLTLVAPYVIVYRIEAETDSVFILRIWHGAQDRDMTDADHDQED